MTNIVKIINKIKVFSNQIAKYYNKQLFYSIICSTETPFNKRINMIKNSPNGEIFKNHAIGR